MFRFSLKYRIAAIIFVLEAFMMAAVLSMTLTHSLEDNKQQLNVNEQVLMNLLGDLSRIALLTAEYDELQPYIESVVADPNVVNVYLTDTKSRIVVSNKVEDIGNPLPDVKSDDYSIWRHRTIKNARQGIQALLIRECKWVHGLRRPSVGLPHVSGWSGLYRRKSSRQRRILFPDERRYLSGTR